MDLLCKFVDDFQEKRPILLIELENVTRLDKDSRHALKYIQGYLLDAQVVISLSSGNTKCLSTDVDGNFRKVVHNYAEAYTVYFSPFTREEASNFIKFNPGYKLSLDVYETLTNFNPKLLSLCRDCDEMQAKSKIMDFVQFFVDEIATTLKMVEFSWINETLPVSKEMFFYAANDMEIPIRKKMDYFSSWIYAESITYIVNEGGTNDNFTGSSTAANAPTTAGVFKLGINFPKIYEVLMKMFLNHKPEIIIHSAIIDGFHFEYSICSNMKVLHLAYSKQRATRFSFPSWKKIATINIAMSLEMDSRQPVKNLLPGVLYHLRPNHPVIDAVGYFVESGMEYLLLIQVSLSKYSDHRSPAGDIKDLVRGCEHTFDEDAKDWLEYYCRRTPSTNLSTLTCIYLYICPTEFYERGDLVNMFRPGSKTKDIFFGLVIHSSPSATEIKKTYHQVTHH